MKRILVLVAMAVALAGCGDKAKELYETARFEEQQFNVDHARKLYERIVADHPDSPYAGQARERLEELEQSSGK